MAGCWFWLWLWLWGCAWWWYYKVKIISRVVVLWFALFTLCDHTNKPKLTFLSFQERYFLCVCTGGLSFARVCVMLHGNISGPKCDGPKTCQSRKKLAVVDILWNRMKHRGINYLDKASSHQTSFDDDIFDCTEHREDVLSIRRTRDMRVNVLVGVLVLSIKFIH